jgi:hypothetical protein
MNKDQPSAVLWVSKDFESLYISNIYPTIESPLFSNIIKQVLLAVPMDLENNLAFDHLSPNSPAITESPFKGLVGLPLGEFLQNPNKHASLGLYEYCFRLSNDLMVSNILGGDLLIQNARKSILFEILDSFGVSMNDLPFLEFGWLYRVKNGVILKLEYFTDDIAGYVCANPELIVNLKELG